jgi:hypothetical protein
MGALTLALLFTVCPQDQSPLPKEPIKDWKYQLKDIRRDLKTKLDVEEVTLILDGKEAIPRSLTKEKEIFDLRGIDARYFTTPGKGDPKSREILVKADRGTIDKGARTLKLDDNVRVTRKADPTKTEVDTILLTPSALLRFNRMYECPTCRKVFGALGTCPDHGEALLETTITSLETDREFVLTGPEGVLSGVGLVTDDAIRKEYHIARDGFVEFSGDLPASDSPKTPALSQTRFLQVFSRGPLQITGPADARLIHGEGGVRVDHIDLTETLTLQSETLNIDTVRRWDLSATGPVDVLKLDAKGDVVVDGISFTDGESFHATADTLLRTKSEDDSKDVTVLTAKAPHIVSLTRGPSRIDSRLVTINKAPDGGTGTSVFEDVVRSDLVSGTQHFELACGRLVTFAGPTSLGKTEVQEIDATEHVILGGLMAKAGPPSPDGATDPGEAHADHFYWDMRVNRGMLEAQKESREVRITQGSSVIVAPKVLLESPEIFVLKGPKHVLLVQDRDGKREEYRATCDGDMIIDSSAEHNRLWMRDNCVVRTVTDEESPNQPMLLNADRINAVLSPGGRGMESLLALGRVRALRQTDLTTLYGDRLFYRFSDQNLRVYGNPRTVADTGHSTSTQGEVRVYNQKHPRTGELVRYTEMIGDSDGVRIEIDERANPKADEKKK